MTELQGSPVEGTEEERRESDMILERIKCHQVQFQSWSRWKQRKDVDTVL